MPRFYFDVLGFGVMDDFRDAEGLDFPDFEGARREALRTLKDIVRDEIPDGSEAAFAIDLRDEQGPRLRVSLVIRTERLD